MLFLPILVAAEHAINIQPKSSSAVVKSIRYCIPIFLSVSDVAHTALIVTVLRTISVSLVAAADEAIIITGVLLVDTSGGHNCSFN